MKNKINTRKDLNRRTSITDQDQQDFVASEIKKRTVNDWWKESSGKVEMTESPIDMALMGGPLSTAAKIMKYTTNHTVFAGVGGAATIYAGKQVVDFMDFISNKSVEEDKLKTQANINIKSDEKKHDIFSLLDLPKFALGNDGKTNTPVKKKVVVFTESKPLDEKTYGEIWTDLFNNHPVVNEQLPPELKKIRDEYKKVTTEEEKYINTRKDNNNPYNDLSNIARKIRQNLKGYYGDNDPEYNTIEKLYAYDKGYFGHDEDGNKLDDNEGKFHKGANSFSKEISDIIFNNIFSTDELTLDKIKKDVKKLDDSIILPEKDINDYLAIDNKLRNFVKRRTELTDQYGNHPLNAALPNRVDQFFTRDANKIKDFYSKNKNVEVDIVPTYANSDLFKNKVKDLAENDDVVILGHSGSQLMGTPNKELAKHLSESKAKNLYIGSCSFEGETRVGTFAESGKNVHYRPFGTWDGFNPSGKNFDDAMYSINVNGQDFKRERIAPAEIKKDYNITQFALGDNGQNNNDMKKYALGSPFAMPNGEIEGGEVVETPDAQTGTQIQGPKHSQGGIKANIPAGTEIYSDQLKIEGKTMAERKLARDKRLEQIMKSFDKNKSDIIIKRSLERTKQANDFQDEKDLAYQEQVKKMIGNAAQNAMKFAIGDDGKDDLLDLPQYGIEDNGLNSNSYNPLYNPYAQFGFRNQYDNTPMTSIDRGGLAIDSTPAPTLAPMKINPTTPDVGKKDVGMGFTPGDWVGMAGMAIGSISQMANTIANAKATKPIVNHYAGFNEKALQANQKYEDQIDYNKNIAETGAERDLSLAENTARARLRNSASGVGTLRSLDVATDYGANEAKIKSTNQLESVFGQQKAQAESQRVNLLSDQDKMEMAGQERADAGNAANLDAFYTNFSQNIAGITNNIQTLGKDINVSKSRNDFLTLLPKTNAWGIGLDQNMNEYIDPNNGSPVGVPNSGRSTTAGKKSNVKSYGQLFPWENPANPLTKPLPKYKSTYIK